MRCNQLKNTIMVNLITEENIREVLNTVISKLDEAEMELGGPGCSTDAVGTVRCQALSAVKNAQNGVSNILRNLHVLL